MRPTAAYLPMLIPIALHDSPGNREALSNVTDNIPMPPKNSKDFREAEMPRKSLFIGLFACPGSYAHVSAALMSFL